MSPAQSTRRYNPRIWLPNSSAASPRNILTAVVQKAAQERLAANEKVAAIQEQRREECHLAIRQDELARTCKRARETAHAVSRGLHCRHDTCLAIERWILSLVLCRCFHRHQDKHTDLHELCGGASDHARSIKAVRALQNWLPRTSCCQQLLRGASYFSSHRAGHISRQLSVARRKIQSASGTIGSNTTSFGSLQHRDLCRAQPVPRGPGRRRQRRRRPRLCPHRR